MESIRYLLDLRTKNFKVLVVVIALVPGHPYTNGRDSNPSVHRVIRRIGCKGLCIICWQSPRFLKASYLIYVAPVKTLRLNPNQLNVGEILKYFVDRQTDIWGKFEVNFLRIGKSASGRSSPLCFCAPNNIKV